MGGIFGLKFHLSYVSALNTPQRFFLKSLNANPHFKWLPFVANSKILYLDHTIIDKPKMVKFLSIFHFQLVNEG